MADRAVTGPTAAVSHSLHLGHKCKPTAKVNRGEDKDLFVKAGCTSSAASRKKSVVTGNAANRNDLGRRHCA